MLTTKNYVDTQVATKASLAQVETASYSWSGSQLFNQMPVLASGTNLLSNYTDSNMLTSKLYVDNQVATKQDTITESTNITLNALILNGNDVDTTFAKKNNDTLTSPTINNSLIINGSNNTAQFNSGVSMKFNSKNYYLFPQYLPTFFSCGRTSTIGTQVTNIPVQGATSMTDTQITSIGYVNCYVNWAIPTNLWGLRGDSAVNTCIVEVSYYLQDCKVMTSGTQQIFKPSYSSDNFTTTTPTTVNSTVGYTLNSPLLYGVQRYIISTSLRYAASTEASQLNGTAGNCIVKYLDGTFIGTSNANGYVSNYGINYIPISFLFNSYNKIKIQFGFPSFNNTPTTTTYGNNYITGYGCSVRIINSDSGSNTPFACPNNNQTQPIGSLSMCGRAYLSTS
jgi:hypothetical protein